MRHLRFWLATGGVVLLFGGSLMTVAQAGSGFETVDSHKGAHESARTTGDESGHGDGALPSTDVVVLVAAIALFAVGNSFGRGIRSIGGLTCASICSRSRSRSSGANG